MLMSESLEDLRERFHRRRALEGKELKVNVHGRESEESRVEDRTRRRGVRAIAEGMRCIRPPSVTRKKRIKTGLVMMRFVDYFLHHYI